MSGELIIVTGASSGIGAATARELASCGFHVLAGVRRERDADSIRATGIEPIILDITNPEHVRSLAARVDSEPRALRALINNAGIGANAPVEAFALDEWRRLFEVNFFGHMSMTQSLLPTLIRSRGRVINISSVGGRVAMATYGPYAATKFALEAVSDALRREMAPLGVHVVVIEPGAIRTEMGDRAIATARGVVEAMTPAQAERYGGLVEAINTQTASAIEAGLPAEAAAKVIARAVTARKPRTRYTVGREAAMLGLMGLFPDRALDFLFAYALRPHFPKALP